MDLVGSTVCCTVDLVIFACLHFRELLILGLFAKFGIREFTFSISSDIIIIIFARFLHSRICPPREICEKLKPREYYQIYCMSRVKKVDFETFTALQ